MHATRTIHVLRRTDVRSAAGILAEGATGALALVDVSVVPRALVAVVDARTALVPSGVTSAHVVIAKDPVETAGTIVRGASVHHSALIVVTIAPAIPVTSSVMTPDVMVAVVSIAATTIVVVQGTTASSAVGPAMNVAKVGNAGLSPATIDRRAIVKDVVSADVTAARLVTAGAADSSAGMTGATGVIAAMIVATNLASSGPRFLKALTREHFPSACAPS